MVAVDLLGFVTERATDAELAELREHVGKQAQLLDDPEGFMLADLHFARLMVRAGRNLALELLYNTVVRLIANNPGFQMAFQSNAPQTMMVYERLVELMAERDPKRVVRIAGRILDRLDNATLSRIRSAVASADDETTPAATDDAQAAAATDIDPDPDTTGARRED
jgi:DNA-binding FadR family transcriptional regulator